MRKNITVAAEHRETRGKNAARRLRMAGRIPAVVYGAGGESAAITVDPKEINRILHSSTGYNTIFDMKLNGGSTPVMVVDWLHDPVKGNLLHIDLKRIDLTLKLRVKIPVLFQGDPVGVKIQGGVFEVISREIEVECLPDAIPESVSFDVAGLNIGEGVRTADIALPEGVVATAHADLLLAHVVATRGSDTAAAGGEEGEAAKAEPEVIKKGKKEEEAAADDKKKKK